MYAGPVIEADQIRTDAIVSRREPNVTDRGPPVDPRGYQTPSDTYVIFSDALPWGGFEGWAQDGGFFQTFASLFLISAHFQHAVSALSASFRFYRLLGLPR